ncbi:Large-conductance mechanosensitive channel [Metamycoplasma auris 15026]|uniref:Large-conductance mechanosensitive channel n=1 Tax=Metamycoplasma auris 15026 TaxID=1188233 RepID=N9VAU9_9BACT|nr:MscL family protein [Metamycoplasma auris]ENY68541.1 Large-conductance mechanosensitive channel [Metamycoplasma auris 15026]
MTKKEKDEAKKYAKKSWKDAGSILKRGNILLLAIGVLLGTVLGNVVSSLANDVIMQAISPAFNFENLENWKVGPGKNILIGKFLAALLSFIIISFFIFFSALIFYLIKNAIEMHKAKKQKNVEPQVEEVVAPTTEMQILEELKKINAELAKIKSQEKQDRPQK